MKTPNVANELGKKILYLRENNNESQETTASKVGIARQTVGAYENGTRVMDVQVLLTYCREYGVSADYLLGLSSVSSVNLEAKAICDKLNITEKTYRNILLLNTSKSVKYEAKLEDGDTYQCEDIIRGKIDYMGLFECWVEVLAKLYDDIISPIIDYDISREEGKKCNRLIKELMSKNEERIDNQIGISLEEFEKETKTMNNLNMEKKSYSNKMKLAKFEFQEAMQKVFKYMINYGKGITNNAEEEKES